MIDLHMHTTASDGRSTPEDLVRRAFEAGIRTMSVTDHDTTAGVARAAAVTLSLPETLRNCVPTRSRAAASSVDAK